MGKLDGCAFKTGLALVVFVVGIAMIPAAIIYLTAEISQGIRVVQANMAVVWVLVAAALAGCWRLAWRMPVGVTSEKVLEQRTAIEQALDCSLRACWYERGLVRAEFGVARLPQRLGWRAFRRRVERRASGMELPVLLGASRVGPLVVDLAEQPHMLVGGSTGSGKSTLLRQAIAGLVVRYDPSALQLVLVDMKGGMEFNTFEGLPHLMCEPVSEVEDAEIQLWPRGAGARAAAGPDALGACEVAPGMEREVPG